MKKLIFSMIFVAVAFSANTLKAQSTDEMKKQVETLKLETDLLNKKIDLQNERDRNAKVQDDANALNRRSEKRTNDQDETERDAKKTAKVLKNAESKNRSLMKSNSKIVDLEADIKKLEMKLDKQKYRVDFKTN